MATGEGNVKKGGDPAYRQQAHHKEVLRGCRAGSWMSEENEKDFGWGAYADSPWCFGTIEMYLAAIGWFYDQVRRTRKGWRGSWCSWCAR